MDDEQAVKRLDNQEMTMKNVAMVSGLIAFVCEYPKNYAEDYLVVANPPEGGFQTCWALHGVILRHNLIVIPGEPDFSAGFVDPVRHQMVFQPQGLYDVYAKNFDYSWKEAAHSVGVDYGKCVDIFGVAIFGDPSKVRIGDPGKNVHSGI